jgi:hypothetical protein
VFEPNEYLEKLRAKLNAAAKIASDVANVKEAEYAHRYTLRSTAKMYHVWDLMIVLNPDSMNKLLARWIGPAEIMEKKGEHSFMVKLPDGGTRCFHQNK